MPQAYLFDAFGTLFDVSSAMAPGGADIVGDLGALSQLWRRKQLEFTWMRALMERYEDFWEITKRALRSASGQLSMDLTDRQADGLMQAYLSLNVFEDVKPALTTLQGKPLAILSNGSPTMLETLIRNNGLGSYFTNIVSAHAVGTYKPSPRVYALGPEILKLPAGDILFVSSNLWDAAGAKAFGYQVCWCNRSGETMGDEEFAPDFIVRGLDQIPVGAQSHSGH